MGLQELRLEKNGSTGEVLDVSANILYLNLYLRRFQGDFTPHATDGQVASWSNDDPITQFDFIAASSVGDNLHTMGHPDATNSIQVAETTNKTCG